VSGQLHAPVALPSEKELKVSTEIINLGNENWPIR